MRQELIELLAPVVESLGYELFHLELVGQGKTSTLRLYIDSPQGIDVDDCAKVSREISALMDVEDPLPEAYQLEVSSPGLDRPLVKIEHFQQFIGEEARVVMRYPLEARRKFKGRIEAVDDGVVVLSVDAEEYRLPVADMEKARLVPRF